MTNRVSASRYARALLDVALAEADPTHVDEQLHGAASLIMGHGDLWAVLTNPAVPTPKKRAILEDVLPRLGLHPIVSKLLVLLAQRDRLLLLPDLVDAYRRRLLDHFKVVRAQVTTAVPLPDTQADVLRLNLGKLTGRTVEMTTVTDPALIGGVVAQIGSTVYDGSVKRQLERMRERLVDVR
ncbi:MAG: ATP synthase F1 subunit delta [Acidobacteriota bacterium]